MEITLAKERKKGRETKEKTQRKAIKGINEERTTIVHERKRN
jgi:hypothetical protein